MRTFIIHEWYIDGGLRVDTIVARTQSRSEAYQIQATRQYWGHDAWIEEICEARSS